MSAENPDSENSDSEQRLLKLLGQLPVVIWTTDCDLRFTASTGAGLSTLGLRPGEAVGVSLYEFFRTRDQNFPAIQSHLVALEGNSSTFEQEWLGNTYRSFVEPFKDAAGEVIGCLGISFDITETKVSEFALRSAQEQLHVEILEQSEKLTASHEQLKTEAAKRRKTQQALQREQEFNAHIISNTPSLISALSPEGNTRFINPAVTQVLGYTADEIIGKNWWQLCYPGKDYKQVEKLYEDLKQGPVSNYQMVVTTKEGAKRTISWSSANRLEPDGTLSEVVGIGTDITNSQQMEQSLRHRQQILRQMLDAYERDRRLISMEMHDGLIQQMTGAVMELQSAHVKLEKNPARAKEQLEKSEAMLQECISEARRLMSGLRPPVLDEAGVIAAIEYLVEELRNDISDVSFESTATFDRLAAPLENTLFRITQESINNLRRYSNAKQAAIRLSDEDHQVHLLIRDDGVGFNLEDVPPDRFGLKGIRERCELLGGTAHISSVPGEGTTVDVFLPKIDALE